MKIVRIVLLAVVAAAGMLVAGPASAAPASSATAALQIQYKVSSISGPPNTLVKGTALCPAGTRMVSSGAGTARITSITPLFDFSGASATGYTGSTPNLAFIRVLVGCLPQSQVPGVSSSRWVSRTGTFFSDVNGFRRGVVTCPAGTRAFGGGGYFAKQGIPTGGTNSMHSNGVTADGTGWTVRGYSPDRNETLVITTQCAPLPGGHVAQANVPLSSTTPKGTVHAPCISGYTMLSGGFYLSKSDGTEQVGTVLDSFPGAEGWIVSGVFSGFSDLKLVALAQCFLSTG